MNELRMLIREAIIETLLAEKMPRGSAMRQPSTSAGRAARLGTTSVYHTQLGLPALRGPGEEPEDADDSHFEPEPPEQVAKHVSRPIRPTIGKPNYKAYIAARGRGPIPTYTAADVAAYDKQYPPEKSVKPREDERVGPAGEPVAWEAGLRTGALCPRCGQAKITSAGVSHKLTCPACQGSFDTAAEQAQTGNVGEKVDFMKEISPELAARYLYAPGGGSHRYIAAMKAARKAKQYGPEAEKAAQSAAEKAGGHYHHAKKAMNKYLDRPDKPTEGYH